MASITIRNLDEAGNASCACAQPIDRSMEDEARDILRTALAQEPLPTGNLPMQSANG
jgi:plasmid stability protein